ncbi:VanZ family protein [Streptomonospora salina]|nr:VanZ family protein [Streptomonospora salina]
MVLLYVDPVTVAAAVGVLLAAAWAVARVMRPRPRAAAVAARVCLVCAAAVYFAVLVQPADGGWAAAGERTTRVEWNPLAGYLQEFAPPDDSVVQTARDRSFYVGLREDLTREQAREVVAEEEEADRNVYAYRFEIGGQAVWLGGDGEPIGEQKREFLVQTGSYGVDPDDYAPAESASLVYEELVVNLLLFVPVGIVAAAAFTPAAARLGTGALLSAGVETSQLILGTGGVAGTGDLIVNGTGGVLGAGAVMGFSALAARRGGRAPRDADRAGAGGTSPVQRTGEARHGSACDRGNV